MSGSGDAAVVGGNGMLLDPTAPLTASGNLRRRAAVSRLVAVGATVAAVIAVAMLGLVVYGVVSRGAPALSVDFVVKNPQGLVGGGILNSLLGTLVIVAFGAAIAAPIGVLTGLYLTEFAGARSRTGRALAIALDVLQGVPTIVVGLFVYGLIVVPQHLQSGFAGAVALAIVMLPLMARASQEVLLLVPNTLREAADSLGVNRWRTVLTVIVPAAMGGIVTGVILATARAAGETAPLLVCDSLFDPSTTQLNLFGHGVPNIPMLIYTSYDVAVPAAITRLWGAAFVLLVFILLANVGARFLLARSRAKMGR
jgi:phosphate transport system permease protein